MEQKEVGGGMNDCRKGTARVPGVQLQSVFLQLFMQNKVKAEKVMMRSRRRGAYLPSGSVHRPSLLHMLHPWSPAERERERENRDTYIIVSTHITLKHRISVT